MDPVTLATGAISLLVPHLAKTGKVVVDKVGQEVWDKVSNKVEKLYETIKNKFIGNDYAIQTLKRLEEKPEEKDRQSAMHSVLKEVLVEDAQFQKMLSQILAEAKQAGGNSVIQIYGSGTAATHGGVAAGERGYAAGRDMIIGRPPSKDEP
jgi:hypothetical protein